MQTTTTPREARIRADVQQLIRSGALDAPPATETAAIRAIAHAHDLTTADAERYWIRYTTPSTATR